MTWSDAIDPGALVVASVVISEPNFSGPNTIHVHAEPDDIGVVVYWDVGTGYPTVRFVRSGTATIVKRDEVWVVGLDPETPADAIARRMHDGLEPRIVETGCVLCRTLVNRGSV